MTCNQGYELAGGGIAAVLDCYGDGSLSDYPNCVQIAGEILPLALYFRLSTETREEDETKVTTI